MDSPTVRIGMPAVALYIFYWGIFLAPPAEDEDTDPGALSFVETRKLIEKSRDLMEKQKYPEALEVTMKLHTAFPQSHIYLQQLGVLYALLGRLEDEAESLEKYILNSPTPQEACPEIGRVYLKLRRIDKAKDAFERCFSLDQDDADSTFFLAHFNERYGNNKRAEELYAKGLTRAPRYPDMQLGLARMKLRHGGAKQAYEIARDVLARNPENSDALFVAGIASLRLGANDAAREYLRKGQRISPGNPDFREALAQLGQGKRS